MIELFAKIVYGLEPFTVFVKKAPLKMLGRVLNMPLVLFFDSKMKNRLLDLVVQVTFFGVFTVVNRLQKH